jgi:predicted dehydrogenase
VSTYNIAYIGTGGRAVAYSKHYIGNDEIRTVAIADPSLDHRKLFLQRSELTGQDIAEYESPAELLANHLDELDGAVIASPNHLHADHAVPLLERGLPLAIEKPLATTPADCRRILDAERANGGRTLLGFVLRSTPIYSKIHEMLSTGVIGKVLSIQADELPGLSVSSIMNRSMWRRYARTSGGAMLEKCCHDMDILNWMMNSRPVSLDSFGGRRIFNPNGFLPDTCDDCPIAETCQYYKQPAKSDHEDQAEGDFHKYLREDDSCIFNIDKDGADVQSVCMEYENGGVVNFLLNFHAMGPKASRNFHAMGTRGQVWGNLHDAKVFHYDNLTDNLTEHDCSGDGSGHGGGDRRHALQLLTMMKDPAFVPEANASAGYLSAMMCFASDLARTEGRRVHFRYEDQHDIRLV